MYKTTRYMLLVGIMSTSTALATFVAPAQAGFQWTSAVNVEKPSAQAPRMPQVPAPSVELAPPPSATVPYIAMEPLNNGEERYGKAPEIYFDDAPSMSPAMNDTQNYGDNTAQPSMAPAPYAGTASPVYPPVMNQNSGVNMPVQTGPTPITPRRVPPSRQDAQQAPVMNDMAGNMPMPQNTAYAQPAPTMQVQQPSSSIDFVPTYAGQGNLAPSPYNSTPQHSNPAHSPYVDESAMPAARMPVSPMMAPTPAMSSNYAPIQPQSPASEYPLAVGFGSDLPMMTAIKQIIPEGYGLAFEAGVPTNMMMSWQGGRPWNDVLATVLAPHGLEARIQGNIVSIAQTNPYIIPGNTNAQPMNAGGMAPVQNVLRAPTEGPKVQMSPIVYDSPATLSPITQDANSGLLQNAVGNSEPASLYQTAVMQTPAPIMGSAPMVGGGYAPAGAPTSLLSPAAAYTGSTGPISAESYGGVAPVTADLYDRSVNYWTAPKSSTLREVLDSWTRKAGVELFWASEYDYPISTAVNIEGDFEEAVQVLLKGLEESNPRPLGRLHPNLPNGPSVLVIETRRLTD